MLCCVRNNVSLILPILRYQGPADCARLVGASILKQSCWMVKRHFQCRIGYALRPPLSQRVHGRSIVRHSPKAGGGLARSPGALTFPELQLKAKLGSAVPSDEVEVLKFEVKWEPTNGVLGVIIDQGDTMAS
ncbi:hypothetical protein JVU11DRAFT_7218 [Chiua virens]|nr:hypothetical protein JVU11DRAFT_7218 [Chiua virens]